MGEILQDSEQYILQWWDEFYGRWRENRASSLRMAKVAIKSIKALYEMDGLKIKYRIVKETTKQEVVYNEEH